MPGEKRFVFSVRIIGAMRRETPKLKMFVLSVLWSDENEVIIYRSYDDFKNFHRQLKKNFPYFNPSQNNNRMIPKFSGDSQKNGLQQRGSKRAIQRIKNLQSYCNKLVTCEQMVTHCSEFVQFFTPLDRDLDGDFTKNSLMMLLSDDNSDGGGVGGGDESASVTRPFVTETYRCVAAYETKDIKNCPFKVATDETLQVLIKDPAGWWLVENEDKDIAWFPAPYLEKEEDDERGQQREGAFYCAVRNFVTKKADELSVPIGSVVEVLKMSDDGWWLARFNGKVGHVPSMYLQPYSNPRSGLFTLQKKMSKSTHNLTISGVPLDASSSARIVREPHTGQRSAIQPSSRSSGPGYLSRARSIELLETQNLSAVPSPVEVNNARLENRTRSISTSTESSISSVYSSSSRSRADVSSVSPNECGDRGRRNSSTSYMSYGSSWSSGSFSSRDSDTSPITPTVPPRPKKEEILNRCSTMTRKAALETKSRLQTWADPTIESYL
ncbi:NADPH oxidase organizer 1-like [Syngnathus acus]|uniref:NADPH oxidase organizer 1-like n=1 Tax=Syngnathus acus TaxID=161584 RepID=UPI001885ABA0|nr:NADPH oxidase organizer 1-like [Syngnathus acus]